MAVRDNEHERLNHAPAAPARPGRCSLAGAGRRRGFTLIELVIVLAILSVGAAIAIPRYGASIARFRAESAARRVEADLKYAREAAQAASASRTVVFTPGTSSYGIAGVRNLRQPGTPYTVSLREEYGAQITALDFGGDATVKFDGYGRPDSGGGVQVRCGVELWEVTLDGGSGVIRVQRVP